MKDSKPLTETQFKEIFDKMQNNDHNIYGKYTFNDYKIQIWRSEPLTIREKSKRFYNKRRESGLCVRCGISVELNPKTNKPYRYCSFHREEENKKRRKSNKETKIETEVVKPKKNNSPTLLMDNLQKEIDKFRKEKTSKIQPVKMKRKIVLKKNQQQN